MPIPAMIDQVLFQNSNFLCIQRFADLRILDNNPAECMAQNFPGGWTGLRHRKPLWVSAWQVGGGVVHMLRVVPDHI